MPPGRNRPLQACYDKKQKGKDLFSQRTTRLKVLLIHHRGKSAGAALCIHAWRRRTSTTSIMSSAAVSSDAAAMDGTPAGQAAASEMETLRPASALYKIIHSICRWHRLPATFERKYQQKQKRVASITCDKRDVSARLAQKWQHRLDCAHPSCQVPVEILISHF